VKQGGRVAIVVPDSILFAATNYKLREYMTDNFVIDAVISLSGRALWPQNRVNASVLLFRKHHVTTKPQTVFFAKVKESRAPVLTQEEIDEIIHEYRSYKKNGKVSGSTRHVSTMIAKLAKDSRLDYEYYDGQQFLQESHYPVKPLGEIADIQLGAKLEGDSAASGSFEVCVIKGQNIRDHSIDLGTSQRQSIDRNLNYRYLLRPGDLVMTRAGSPGNAGIVSSNLDAPCIASSNVIIIRPAELVDPYYLLAYLISERGRTSVESIIAGSTIRAVSIQNLALLPIPIAPQHVQKSFAENLQKYLLMQEKKRKVLTEIENELADAKKSVDDLVAGLYAGEQND
jgi:type I restriction-modification system DNA methylase subunit